MRKAAHELGIDRAGKSPLGEGRHDEHAASSWGWLLHEGNRGGEHVTNYMYEGCHQFIICVEREEGRAGGEER